MRPVVLISDAGQSDWIACQITSNPYIDPLAISIAAGDFETGGLKHASYVRPGKLFTANESVIAANVGSLKPKYLEIVRQAIVVIIRKA